LVRGKSLGETKQVIEPLKREEKSKKLTLGQVPALACTHGKAQSTNPTVEFRFWVFGVFFVFLTLRQRYLAFYPNINSIGYG
jgi:hypothetical protein